MLINGSTSPNSILTGTMAPEIIKPVVFIYHQSIIMIFP